MNEKITKHRMRQPPVLDRNDMVKYRTFKIVRDKAIEEIGRLCREYDINLEDLKKNCFE